MLYLSGALAGGGGLLAALFIREGPYSAPLQRFNPHQVVDILRNREIVLANLGYLGHDHSPPATRRGPHGQRTKVTPKNINVEERWE